MLLKKHERWLDSGKYEDDLYPLAPGAYAETAGTSGPATTKGERRRIAMREAVRHQVLSERKHEAKMAELDAREQALSSTATRLSVNNEEILSNSPATSSCVDKIASDRTKKVYISQSDTQLGNPNPSGFIRESRSFDHPDYKYVTSSDQLTK
ncbi:hypothetical protein EB796_014710 [Bugula neritina]|uniref:Uncharacterized protein n=1 Tax=Bugula neritina TaxID=10212 RepID=A0A7J7JKW8_BUGNE|nr:hypothetical protein EB796_014710 [Bugula neritina]